MLGCVEVELFWQAPLLVRVILWLCVRVWGMCDTCHSVTSVTWGVTCPDCPPCCCCSCSVMLIDSQMMSRWPEDCCLYTPSSSGQGRYRLGSCCCCWPGLAWVVHNTLIFVTSIFIFQATQPLDSLGTVKLRFQSLPWGLDHNILHAACWCWLLASLAGAQLQEPCPVHFHYFYLKEQEVSNKLPTFHILFLSNLGI